MYKKISLISMSLLIATSTVLAFDLDYTVDDDIRKNYNSEKLIKDTHTEKTHQSLPNLPDISKYETEDLTPIKENLDSHSNTQNIQITNVPYKGNIKVPAGTSFNVTNYTKVNDWMGKGSSVKFYTKQPIIKRRYTIPSNTIFYGEIIETHQPRITGNGGLVVIRVKKMNYKGHIIPVNAYITRADGKKIFLNNIKGERKYLKTMWKKGNWGRTLFNKMSTITVNLGKDGSTLLFSPFPFAYGTICLGLNTITSPICAFFSKGGHVSIPEGSDFRIKLMDEIYIN